MLLKHATLLGDILGVYLLQTYLNDLLEWVFSRFISITVIKEITFFHFHFKGVSTAWRLSSTLINYLQTCMWTGVKARWRLRTEAVVAQDHEIREGRCPALYSSALMLPMGLDSSRFQPLISSLQTAFSQPVAQYLQQKTGCLLF